MTPEHYAFFNKVTLSICGSLDASTSLHATLLALRDRIPVDQIYIELYEAEMNCMRYIAKADESGGEDLDIIIPLPEEAKQQTSKVQQSIEENVNNSVQRINEHDDLSQYLLDIFKLPPSSILGLPLIIDGAPFAAIILSVEGYGKYTQEHADLLFMLRKPFTVALSNAIKHRDILELKNLLADDNRFLHKELNRNARVDIVGADFGLKPVMDLLSQVAPLDSPVLLLGETGVGKDVVANAIHQLSPRRDKPFIAVNCGGIPDNLVDSELFGHEKGAFTGASAQKRGRFERADGGTIFLDEIGELPLQAQVRLLRVLQDQVIERVGGVKPIKLDLRIIAATNRRLEEMIEEGTFREDLWFRLNVFPIEIPPLRNRLFDVPALVHHFIMQKVRDLKLPAIPKVSEGAMEPLMGYNWPGNVRELQNIVERSLILNPKGPVTFDQFYYPGKASFKENRADHTEIWDLDDMVKAHISKALAKTEGKVHGEDGAARLLGINASTLRNKMNKLRIAYGKRRKGE